MYYYEKDHVTEIEDMVMDFLVYRRSKKSKKAPEYKTQGYEMGKGWPYYQDYPLLIQNDSGTLPPMREWPAMPTKMEETPFLAQPLKSLPAPKSCPDEIPATDAVFFSRHYGPACKLLHIHAKEVVKEYDYKGSPIHDEHMGSETLFQITEKVLNRAQGTEKEIKKILQKEERADWDSHNLLCSLVESLVLVEIYLCRGYKQKKWVKNDWDYVEYV